MDKFITQIGQSRIILVFIMTIGFIVGYLNYSNSEPVLIEDGVAVTSRDSIESFANFNLDFSILEDETYRSLEIFGENPVDPGVVGRDNPFNPI